MRNVGWQLKVLKRWGRKRFPRSKTGEELRHAIETLASALPARATQFELQEQPFDRLLLTGSRIYRRSRELYLQYGGAFRPSLVSTPRTLSSVTLIQPLIQYSPIESEYIWSATDPGERTNLAHLMTLRTYAISPAHEQNHRILWQQLPPPPTDRDGLRRYLNLAESMVVALDMAIGDELGPELARVFYLAGVIYDPGTDIRKARGMTPRMYRNYLHAVMYATYLHLEFYSKKGIAKAVRALFANLPDEILERALNRSGNLDPMFVQVTNPAWQEQHGKTAGRGLQKRGVPRLELPEDPMNSRLAYLHAEAFFERMKI
jgi:hypothetical protein